jgi:flagellar biosynthesis protein
MPPRDQRTAALAPGAAQGMPLPYQSGLENRALAESILQRARRAGLYAHESPDLIALLMGVDLDRRVPRELYDTVAVLLLWLHALDAAHPPPDSDPDPDPD